MLTGKIIFILEKKNINIEVGGKKRSNQRKTETRKKKIAKKKKKSLKKKKRWKNKQGQKIQN